MKLEGEVRIPSGCAIAGIIDISGKKFCGEEIIKSISVMRERSNGLGGGFAAYGIYENYKDYYAFHIFFDNNDIRKETEIFLENHFDIINLSRIPTKLVKGVLDSPLIWRYFVTPLPRKLEDSQLSEEEYTVKCVFKINSTIKGAYVFSSGKNMGIFKAVGYPEDVGRFYRLDEYEGYSFTAHGRYPTNTPGWWGGAHPFGLRDFSVVHNGEISSYDANRRNIEMHGYRCTLSTDTEVIAYVFDYLTRRVGLTLEETAQVIAAPFWEKIDSYDIKKREKYEFLRDNFSSYLITGPFSILVGFSGGIMALNDRLKLRSLIVGEKGDKVYMASEECAIIKVADNLDKIYSVKGGEPIIIKVKEQK